MKLSAILRSDMANLDLFWVESNTISFFFLWHLILRFHGTLMTHVPWRWEADIEDTAWHLCCNSEARDGLVRPESQLHGSSLCQTIFWLIQDSGGHRKPYGDSGSSMIISNAFSVHWNKETARILHLDTKKCVKVKKMSALVTIPSLA